MAEKNTSAVRQWMAKENREAGHMLGHNDPKNTKTTEKQAQMRKGAGHNDSISQQAAQAMLWSSHTYEKSIVCVCWLCLHRMLLEREGRGGKIPNSLFSMAVQIINVKKKSVQEQVLLDDATQIGPWLKCDGY